jgi:hypothetical protein
MCKSPSESEPPSWCRWLSGGVREGGGDRPWNDELGGGGDGGWATDDRDERGGAADDAVGGGLHEERRQAGGADRQEAGGGEPREHFLLREAVHREEDVGGGRGGQAGLLQGRQRRKWQRQARLPRPRQAFRPRGNLCPGIFYLSCIFISIKTIN